MTGPTREWATFIDSTDHDREWQVDVTFLASHWQCIYGCGCEGVLTAPAASMAQGCCSYGAHFSDKKDRNRVVRAAKKLTDDEWQFAKVGRKRGVVAQVGNEWRTRLVDDACIFLNRPGFGAGPGCALHVHAMRTGIHHSELKPDVCWQLPLRRLDDEDDDGNETTRLTEFARDGWGEGGEEFAWWCTEAPEAFTGREPVYRSLEPELRKMIGDHLYEQIAAYLDGRLAGRVAPARHPAEVPVKISRTRSRARG
jgi:hypothetical protein